MTCKRPASGLGLILTLAHLFLAASVHASSKEEVVISDTAVRETRIAEKILFPEASTVAEVRLRVDNPGQLDLDLFVYDSDPTNSYPTPLCASNNIHNDEVCAVKRPNSGEIWALVAAVDGSGKSRFTLTKNFVDSSHADLALAEPISPNGSGVHVDPENMSFQFGLDAREVATVVLEGEERNISVEDEHGNIFRALKTDVGRQQIAIGEKFQTRDGGSRDIDWLLRGLKEPTRYLIRVGPSVNPYGQADTVLTVVTPTERPSYVIAFASENLDNEPNMIQGPSRNLTRPGTNRPILFKFLPRSSLMIAQALPAEVYDVAICDKFGFVASISPEEVLWNPKREDAHQARASSEDMYFAVFPSPFSQPSVTPDLPKLTLLIKPPATN